MKKYLIIPLIIAITLAGCSKNKTSNLTEGAETLSQKEIFTKFMDDEDLRSYILKTNAKEMISLDSGQKEETSIFMK